MGRYYNGEIEGKFWFAVQASNAADRFGVEGKYPEIDEGEDENFYQYLDYFFYEDDLPLVNRELEAIKENLGEYFQKFEDFFNENSGWNHEILIEAGFPENNYKDLLSDYADYHLGLKIKACLEKNGSCEFEAEI